MIVSGPLRASEAPQVLRNSGKRYILVGKVCMNPYESSHAKDPEAEEPSSERNTGEFPVNLEEETEVQSPLCLKMGQYILPVYELTADHFAIERSPDFHQEATSRSESTGQLFTDNQEVSIPVSFAYMEAAGSLDRYRIGHLTPDAERLLGDLLDLLENDWEEEQPQLCLDESLAAKTDTRQASNLDDSVTLLESSVGDAVSVTNSENFTAVRRGQVVTARRIVFGLAGVALLVFLAIAGGRFANDGPADTETTSGRDDSKVIEGREVREVSEGVIEREQPHGLLRERSQTTQRRLQSELKLAETEWKAAKTKLDEAVKRLGSRKRLLASELADLRERFRQVEGERQLASLHWQEIEPLARRDNVGRKEVEQVKQALADADATYKMLQQEIMERQQFMEAPDLDGQLAEALGISFPSLEADVSVAEARVLYLREQIKIEAEQAGSAAESLEPKSQ